MPKRNRKRENQKSHAIQRAVERYGVIPNIGDTVRKIQAGQAEFVSRSSNRVTIWRVEVGGRMATVVYDSKRKMIATFLP